MHLRLITLLLVATLAVGCSSLPLQQAQLAYRAGAYDEALVLLDSEDIRSRDRLLVLMERGKIEHATGRYQDSINTLLKAAELIDSQDFISISEQTASLAVNEWVTQYRGEYSERLWVHSYLMMNFLILGNTESAAVEARRALNVLSSHPDSLEADFFTRNLMALVFEKNALDNDAYVVYRNLAQAMPDPTAIARSLVYFAKRAGQPEVVEKYQKLLDEQEQSTGDAELVLFIANGAVAQKVAGDLFVDIDTRISFPIYNLLPTDNPNLSINVNQSAVSGQIVSTELSAVNAKSLAARGKTIALKQLARVGVKQGLVNAVEGESETTALLLRAALFILEEADTRGWESLPGRLSLMRIKLPAGTHNISVDLPYTAAGLNALADEADLLSIETPASLDLGEITLQAGQTLYRSIKLP